MSRLPPALARRLDRLARRAHAFHRFSHHPLCGRYRGEVLGLGRRTRLCLGCTLAAAGLAAGLALGAAAGGMVPLPGPAALGGGLLLLAAVPLAMPAAARRSGAAGGGPPGTGGRPVAAVVWKFLTRLLPAAAAGALLGQALAGSSAPRWAAAGLGVAAIGWAFRRYRRRGPDRSACQGCPDGPPGSRCPGYARVVRRERALSRLAGRWIAAVGR